MTSCPSCGHSLKGLAGPLVDLNANGVVVAGRFIKLRPRETEVLKVLADKLAHVVSRAVLEAEIWPHDDMSDRALDVHLVALRRKLAGTGLEIENVRGRGWRLVMRSDAGRAIQGAIRRGG